MSHTSLSPCILRFLWGGLTKGAAQHRGRDHTSHPEAPESNLVTPETWQFFLKACQCPGGSLICYGQIAFLTCKWVRFNFTSHTYTIVLQTTQVQKFQESVDVHGFTYNPGLPGSLRLRKFLCSVHQGLLLLSKVNSTQSNQKSVLKFSGCGVVGRAVASNIKL